jgi:hypothetical protein
MSGVRSGCGRTEWLLVFGTWTAAGSVVAAIADGSLDGEVGDANDWRVMERGICKMGAIRPDSLCGQIGSWGF